MVFEINEQTDRHTLTAMLCILHGVKYYSVLF